MVAPVVVKLGGAALEPATGARELACAIATIDAPVVLVHGGGGDVSDWCRRLGHESRFERGLRVTDAVTLDVAAAVLGGLANARLVAGLRAAGVDAVGLGALDGGTIDAEPHADAARLGRVGVARRVRPRLLELLLGNGHVPVVSSIGADAEGLLNLNADEVAAALAGALRARALVMLSDVPGLVLDGRFVPELEADQIPGLLEREDVKDGMIPKLEAAARALSGGASRVLLAAWQGPETLSRLLAGTAPATVVRPTLAEATRV